MTLTRRTLTLVLAGAVALGGALPAMAQQAESVIETIQKRGVIKIGLSLFVPWSMRDLNGDLVGFELDVGRQLAEDMGVEAEFIPTSWDGIIPALVAGNFDVIISGMTVTPQRNLTVNFSQPYAYSGMTILANTAMTEGFTLEDYNSADVTFSARRGATPATVIADMFPKATLNLFDEDGAATQEVLNGNAHATMSSEPGPSDDARRNPETLSVPFDQAFQAGGEGIAMRKGDSDALAYFNSWITWRTNTGWLKERHTYWFRGDEWKALVEQ
ncbi:transporter substrate-binding domain-containing protein [Puniceibacterium sp. IMCC21224]|uniref:transporter substrate-binding domain-containing protein n=1 Tax=Puniceibacterium sp. IMCC21224 TaxID=1618204 RepID=UPI00064DCCDD|nr:transporter substrate-binding domain-containing protein [Puniceibacterium sp. IMCC21224]KMK67787.1 amino acid ABC transporter substrate-binding protein, PAAT family [Puniceibacterium sp. IMCC21224]